MARTRSQAAAAAAAAAAQLALPQPPPQQQQPQQQEANNADATTQTQQTTTHTPLYLLVASENWAAVEHRCRTHPSEASSLTPTENLTPLHVACLCDPPPSAVGALLRANPDAVSSRTSTGLVPLHFACIKSDPEVVRLLIRADVSTVNCRSSSKRVTPLSLLCNKYYHLVKDLRTSTSEGDDDDDDDDACEKDLEQNPELRRVWVIGCMLVRAAYHGLPTPPPPPVGRSKLIPDWNVLRACAGMEECCWLFVTLCLKLRTDWVFDADEFGNLPLHTAASSPHKPNPDKITAIDVLTTVYPDGCRVRNGEGKLPLHLALESGKRWEGGVCAIHTGWRGAAVVAEGEERRGGGGGLYPFMRAAVARPSKPPRSGGRKRDGDDKDEDDGDIDAIYHLLRDCPELERFAASAAAAAASAASSSKKCGGGGPHRLCTLRTIGRAREGGGGGGATAAKVGSTLGVVVGEAAHPEDADDDDDEDARQHVVVAEQVRDPRTRRRHVHVFVEGGDGTRRLRNPKRRTTRRGAAPPSITPTRRAPSSSSVVVGAKKRARGAPDEIPDGVRDDATSSSSSSSATTKRRRRGRPVRPAAANKRPRYDGEVGVGLVPGDDDHPRTGGRRRITRGMTTRVTRSIATAPRR